MNQYEKQRIYEERSLRPVLKSETAQELEAEILGRINESDQEGIRNAVLDLENRMVIEARKRLKETESIVITPRQELLIQQLIESFKNRLAVNTRGILLAGPPGIGKTVLARQIAKD